MKNEHKYLDSTHPLIAQEAHGWDPATVSRGSDKARSWKCKLGHVWSVSPNVRTSKGTTGCPVCAGQQVLAGYNDLATTHPELSTEADGWDPTSFTRGTRKKVAWKCKFEHSWEATIHNRTVGGNGCPYCSHSRVIVGINDLQTTNPEVASQAYGWDPTELSAGSSQTRGWICSLGHHYQTSPVKRVARNQNCPVCSGHTVLKGFNDVATTDPVLAAQASGWDPTTRTRGSGAKVGWKCSFDHQWKAVINSRSLGKLGCPICAGQQVLAGFNDLATTHPILAKEAEGWDPAEVSRGSDLKNSWLCSEGHRWKATVASRVAGVGCPTCATSGFDPNAEAWLYFLTHTQWGMLQIGITNFPDQRLKSHGKFGWKVVEVRGPMDGLIAREWETSILQMLRRHGAKLSAEEVAGKFSGYTESWMLESYPAKSLRELMDAVLADEDEVKAPFVE